MASIRERAGNYRVEWRRGGRGGQAQSCTLPTQKLAEAAKALAESRHHDITDAEVYRIVLNLDDTTATTPLFGAWVDDWAKLDHDAQPDVHAGYLRALRRWAVPYLKSHRLDELDQDVHQAWITWLRRQTSARGRPLAPASIHRIHAVVHQCLAAAVPQHLSANPFARQPGQSKRKGLPAVPTYDAVFLEPWEADLIVAHCPPDIADLIYIAPRTGLRLGELLALRIGDDVKPSGDNPLILVQRALKNDGTFGKPKSARSRRTVSLGDAAAKRLADRCDGRRKGSLVWASSEGTPLSKDNVRERYFKQAVAAAQRCPDHPPPAPVKAKSGPARKLRLDEVSTCECPGRLRKTPRFHDLRHTHVAWLIAAGWDVFAISRRLGHESVKTTFDLYGHLLPQGERDRLASLDEFIDG